MFQGSDSVIDHVVGIGTEIIPFSVSVTDAFQNAECFTVSTAVNEPSDILIIRKAVIGILLTLIESGEVIEGERKNSKTLGFLKICISQISSGLTFLTL